MESSESTIQTKGTENFCSDPDISVCIQIIQDYKSQENEESIQVEEQLMKSEKNFANIQNGFLFAKKRSRKIRKNKNMIKIEKQKIVKFQGHSSIAAQKDKSNVKRRNKKIEKKTSIIRQIKKWFGLAQFYHPQHQFIQYLRKQNYPISTCMINSVYSSNRKKSKKYLLHSWTNIVYQGYGSTYFQFLKNYLPEIIKTAPLRYSDKPSQFSDLLVAQILRIFQCFDNYQQKKITISQTINQIYNNIQINGKNAHQTIQKQARKCIEQLGKYFPGYQLRL